MGRLDLNKLLPPRTLELGLLSEPRVTSCVEVPVTCGENLEYKEGFFLLGFATYDCFVRVPDEEDGGVVDLSVMVVLHLELAGHVGALPRGVAVGLHSHHQPGLCWHPLAIETFLTEGDIVVHTARVVASDSLYQISVNTNIVIPISRPLKDYLSQVLPELG